MLRFFYILSCLLLSAFAATAAGDIVKVAGESHYIAEPTHSLVEAKRNALEQARIAALAKEFGTSVAQDVYQRDIVSGHNESTYFNMLNITEVNGEWIADDGQPEYIVGHDSDGCYVITCRVKGTARRISNESVDFEALVLRNGNECRFADSHFRPGDDLKLFVRVPVNGYLLVYLVGEDNDVYSLLPYSNESDGVISIRRDRDYVFFDTAKADATFGVPDELTMTLSPSRQAEQNHVYVIFSPEPFTKAADRSSNGLTPRTLPLADFHKWLANVRRRDPKMGMKVMHLSIDNN